MTRPTATACLALGGNLGDVLQTFRAALRCFVLHGVEVVAVSSAFRTRAEVLAGAEDLTPDYWNAASVVHTQLLPRQLLSTLHVIEAQFGRARSRQWADRTLDLDLIAYDNCRIDEPDLVVPHPRASTRLYVLRPLAEIARDVKIGSGGKTVGELLAGHQHENEGILERLPEWLGSLT